jgi:ABC-type dipeptide/oligopeptide/nickel transport system ATPase component
MGDTETLLSVRNLSVDIPTANGVLHPVRNVDFTVERGKTLGIVGESGCGKSLTALSLMGLLPFHAIRTADELRLGDDDLQAISMEVLAKRIRGDRIAMIFQEPMTSLNPVLSINEQLSETLITHFGISKAEARAKSLALLEMVGISDPKRRLNQYPHHLSGGMRQRVMIAMALSCEPKLIIADEPTTALDVTIQAQILELMKDLTKSLGVSMIIITHNLGVVARYADRVNVMYAGKIIETGSAHDIYHNPQHPYTLALLNSIPRMDQPRQDKLDPVEGQPPDLTQLDERPP